MSKEVKPALRPEDWASGPGVLFGDRGAATLRDGYLSVGYDMTLRPGPERHALAALALHGQPFGFTQADVDLLRRAIVLEQWEAVPDSDERERLDNLAARIAALLPPGEP